jgi:hypothetical protein
MNIAVVKQCAQTIQERLAGASYDELVDELERCLVHGKRVRADEAWLRAEIAQRELDGNT